MFQPLHLGSFVSRTRTSYLDRRHTPVPVPRGVEIGLFFCDTPIGGLASRTGFPPHHTMYLESGTRRSCSQAHELLAPPLGRSVRGEAQRRAPAVSRPGPFA